MQFLTVLKNFLGEDEEILRFAKNKKSIIILNKMDLVPVIDENNEKLSDFKGNIIKMSLITKDGIEDLYKKIEELFNMNEINVDSEVVITNLRQKNLIFNALKSVEKAAEAVNNGTPLDIVAIFIKEILEEIGFITGDSVTEDIIDEIFSKFCLGK